MSEQLHQSQNTDQLPLGTGLQAEQGQLRNFDVLQEPHEVAATLEAFQSDQLLARAMDGPPLTRDGINFVTIDDELGFMAGEGGMQHVSTTLLVQGESIPVYKPFGFLVNSELATVEHVAEQDSLSSVDSQGNLRANASAFDLATLGELADHVHETHARDMNEVNVTFSDDALRGLFTANYVTPKLDALVTQRHIQEQGRGALPLFLYDRNEGKLQSWVPDTEEIRELASRLPSRMRTQYIEALALDKATHYGQMIGSIAVPPPSE